MSVASRPARPRLASAAPADPVKSPQPPWLSPPRQFAVRRVSKDAATPPTSTTAAGPKAQQPPSGEAWLHEIKHDGFRVIARFERHPSPSAPARDRAGPLPHRPVLRKPTNGGRVVETAGRPFPSPCSAGYPGRSHSRLRPYVFGRSGSSIIVTRHRLPGARSSIISNKPWGAAEGKCLRKAGGLSPPLMGSSLTPGARQPRRRQNW